ncbi:MAG: NapC/NirT family cytochrome c [Phycisphaerales bacterium]|nr:MAG: NapC/NirT family cytochrome c [Phycisphaerales bacterium]
MRSPGDPSADSQGPIEESGSGGTDLLRWSGSRPGCPDSPQVTPLWNNPITMVGVFLAIVGLLGLLTFLLFSLAAPASNPYVDIIGFLVMPLILVFGLMVMPLGIFLRVWRLRRCDPGHPITLRLRRIDLSDPVQLRAVKVVVGGTFVFLPVVGVTSYQGYHFTDSIEFCAEACHTVMKPQAVTFARSGHARVACAECHIGSGAGWFVKSKLSGTRQVVAVLRDSYSRPIPPAIKHLRPARETCEHCHWPDKFFGDQLVQRSRFAADDANTPQQINMLLKTGGGARRAHDTLGIHTHVALAGRIEFVAVDEKLQEIPWVKLTNKDGSQTIYRSDGRASSDSRPEGQVRQMDCMDCHNRPAHAFLAPADAVDIALSEGALDPTLPYIKRQAVAALVHTYADPESAGIGITNALTEFYRSNYPEVWGERPRSIGKSTEAVVDIYRRSFFPHMKVDWRTYPDNIGHKISPGCFRCHAGHHVTESGQKISHACANCHTFLNAVEGDGESMVLQEGGFIHSPVLEGRHAELLCDKCHTGGVAPQGACAGCHTEQADFRAGNLSGFESLDIPAEPMADSVDCQDCHDLSQPTDLETIDASCMDCHEDEEERFTGMLATWEREVKQLMANAERDADTEMNRMLHALRQAGPLHNVEAARTILGAAVDSRTTD